MEFNLPLREFFPFNNQLASINGGHIEGPYFKRIFENILGDNDLDKIKSFLSKNGYSEFIDKLKSQDQLEDYCDGPISLTINPFLEHSVILIIEKDLTALSDFQIVNEVIRQFNKNRDWSKFHNPKDLAIALNLESSELLELFLWKDHDKADIEKVKRELADVLTYSFIIADKYGLDIKEIILQKIEENGIKYPIQKAKGNSKKYNEL